MKMNLRPVILISALSVGVALGAIGCDDNASRRGGNCNCQTGENCSAADLATCAQNSAICDCTTGKTFGGDDCTEDDMARCEGGISFAGCDCKTGEGCSEEQLANCPVICDCVTKTNCSTAQLASCPECDCETESYCSTEELAACNACDCMTKTNCTEEELVDCPACSCKSKKWCSEAELAECPVCDCKTMTNCSDAEKANCPPCDCLTREYCSKKDIEYFCGQGKCDCLTKENCSEEALKICEETQCDCETREYCTSKELAECPDQQKRECDCSTGEDCYEDEWAECTKGQPDLCNCVTREGCSLSSLSRCPRRFFTECEYNKDCEENFVCKDQVCVPSQCTNETIESDCGEPPADIYWWSCWEGFCHLNGGGSSPHVVSCHNSYDCADINHICKWGYYCGTMTCECKTTDCDTNTRCFGQDNYCSNVDSICKKASRFVRIDDMSPTCDMQALEDEVDPETGEHPMRCINDAPGARIDAVVVIDKDKTEHYATKVVKYYRSDNAAGVSKYVAVDEKAILGEPDAFVNYKASKDCRYYQEGTEESDKVRPTTFVALGGKGGYIVAQFDSHTFIGARTQSIRVLELGACNLTDNFEDKNTGKEIKVSVSPDGTTFQQIGFSATPNEKNYGVLQWDRQYANLWKNGSWSLE